ncbi:MAG: hypothetical protein AAFU55_13115, partial [Pseudomonadota bacterium]
MIDFAALNAPLAAAAGLSALTACVHAFLGGRDVAKPLLEADMARAPKLTNYYCWHIVTIVLVAMTLGFAYAATAPSAVASAVTWTLIAAAFAIWSVALFLWKRMHPFALPQWALFAPIAALGVWG